MKDGFLEFLSAIVGIWIYGTPRRPRHPIWRNLLRAFTFGGAIVAAMVLLRFPVEFHPPLFLGGLWGFGLITVGMAEYDLGWPPLTFAAIVAGAGVVALGLWTETW